MNYIWELLIRAKKENIPEKEISFRIPKNTYSPYMELSFENINTNFVVRDVEVNPYLRFDKIFENFFHPDYSEDMELRQQLFDMMLHYLGYVDCLQGMTRQEYYRRFMCQNIADGIFGVEISEVFKLCTLEEQDILANAVLKLYKTGEGMYTFKQVVQQVFKKIIILANAKEKDELIIFLNEEMTKEKEAKFEMIKNLFLPFQFNIGVYWENIFGIIGTDEVMKVNEMVIY